MLPFISDLRYSRENITLKCIYIIIAAVMINTLFAFITIFSAIVKCVKAKIRNRNIAAVTNMDDTVPQKKSFFSFEKINEGQVT